MDKFKVGDRVKCVDANGCYLRFGHTYVVEKISKGGKFLHFFDDALGAVGVGWFSSRFNLAKPAFKGNVK